MFVGQDPKEVLTWKVLKHKTDVLLIHKSIVQFHNELLLWRLLNLLLKAHKNRLFLLHVLYALILVD